MKKLKQNNAITLVALIITIIVLIILAGVTLNIVLGDNGIINKAKQAKQNMTNASDEEKEWLSEAEGVIESIEETPITNGSWSEVKGVNSPKLDGTGLKGIKLSNNGTYEEIKEGQANWYSYTENDKRWANAKTQDGSMWVWIPRYAYKITYTNPSDKSLGGTIDIVFLKNDTTLDKNGNDVTQSTYENEKGEQGAYIVHPCFKDGTSNGFTNGEWDDEIEGIWVAKFEAGFSGGNNSVEKVSSGLTYGENSPSKNFYGPITVGSTPIYYPVFMPKTYSYNYITISDMYSLSKNLNKSGNPYGLVTEKIDSHMIKNSEWGAVTYLTHSKYGRNKEEISINNVNLNGAVDTICAVTGMSSGTTNSAQIKTTVEAINNGTSGSYSWETANGQKASTTGNIYGIYDLSGGSWENTAAYISDGEISKYGKNIESDGQNNTKYKNVYSYNTSNTNSGNNYNANTSKIGEAIWETSTSGAGDKPTSWNQDNSSFVNSTGAFSARGGHYDRNTSAGTFAFGYTNGVGGYMNGFRAVLIPM